MASWIAKWERSWNLRVAALRSKRNVHKGRQRETGRNLTTDSTEIACAKGKRGKEAGSFQLHAICIQGSGLGCAPGRSLLSTHLIDLMGAGGVPLSERHYGSLVFITGNHLCGLKWETWNYRLIIIDQTHNPNKENWEGRHGHGDSILHYYLLPN